MSVGGSSGYGSARLVLESVRVVRQAVVEKSMLPGVPMVTGYA